MVKNTAFLALLTVFLLVGWVAGEVQFLAPYKRLLFHEHGLLIAIGVLLVFVHLCALYYGVARWLFVRDAGRKLTYLDRQLSTPRAVLEDLSDQLDEERPHVA
jgi:hypothetical protein